MEKAILTPSASTNIKTVEIIEEGININAKFKQLKHLYKYRYFQEMH